MKQLKFISMLVLLSIPLLAYGRPCRSRSSSCCRPSRSACYGNYYPPYGACFGPGFGYGYGCGFGPYWEPYYPGPVGVSFNFNFGY